MKYPIDNNEIEALLHAWDEEHRALCEQAQACRNDQNGRMAILYSAQARTIKSCIDGLRQVTND
jgi:hypothetical protein